MPLLSRIGASSAQTFKYTSASTFVFSPTISTSVTDYDLRASAVTAGWNQTVPLIATVTISGTGVIGSSSTSTAALIWTGSYPTGSTLAVVNNGYIVGRGGNGGAGGSGPSGIVPAQPGEPGSSGGPAMQGNYAISITNNTTIGGGGNGGAGASGYDSIVGSGGGGGGGGGAGYIAGSGGSGGAAGTISGATAGTNGSSGTTSAGGSGGSPSGSTGGSLGGGNCTVSGTNAYITWVTTGTRLGTLG